MTGGAHLNRMHRRSTREESVLDVGHSPMGSAAFRNEPASKSRGSLLVEKAKSYSVLLIGFQMLFQHGLSGQTTTVSAIADFPGTWAGLSELGQQLADLRLVLGDRIPQGRLNDRMGREFDVQQPNQVWCGYIGRWSLELSGGGARFGCDARQPVRAAPGLSVAHQGRSSTDISGYFGSGWRWAVDLQD